jgi:peptidoglycan hydrolase-like protein with peptidoglycan-binding domain
MRKTTQTSQARRGKAKGGTRARKAVSKGAPRRKTLQRSATAGYSRAAVSVTALPLKGYSLPTADLKRGASGTGVRQLQAALVKLGHMTQAQMNTGPGTFGPQTEASLKKFQKAQGVDAIGVYGPATRTAFKRLGATIGGAGTPPPPAPPQGLRQKIVAEGQWGVANKARIHYAQTRPIDGLKLRHKLPLTTDCSGFVTLCYKWAGAPDPNGSRYNGDGNTRMLEAHMRQIPLSQVQPGDLCLWQRRHVSLVLQGGADPLLISHGNEKGPYAVRTSAQKKSYPAGTRLIWLTSPPAGTAALKSSRKALSAEDKARGDPPTEEGLPEEDMLSLEDVEALLGGEAEVGGTLRKMALAVSLPLKGYTLPVANLKRGASGTGVRQLQTALVKLGDMTQAQMNTGPGTFGPQTEASLKKFQKAHGVDALGVYGSATRTAFKRLGATIGGGAGTPPPSAHKNPFLAQFQRALTRLKLPTAWASGEALWQLVQHESSWNPRAKNPNSTAFGLFQFIRSTWAAYCKEGPYGSTDPYVQALGGFRYIKSRYKTPEGAWAFWQKHHWY